MSATAARLRQALTEIEHRARAARRLPEGDRYRELQAIETLAKTSLAIDGGTRSDWPPQLEEQAR